MQEYDLSITKKTLTNILWLIYISLIFLFLIFINFKTPLIGEDYALILFSDNNTELVNRLFSRIIDHFNPNTGWSLRHGDTLTSIMISLGSLLGIGKALFNILNPIVTMIFFTLIYFWGNCRLPNINRLKDLIVFSAIPALFLICSFSLGEIFFWFTGATNYLWSAVILLGVGVPYRKYLHNSNYFMKKHHIAGFMIASYLAGFTNENTVPIIILLGGFLLLRAFFQIGIKNIPCWLLLSVLSMNIGYSILLFSPSTRSRSAFYREIKGLQDNISVSEIINNINSVLRSFYEVNYRFLSVLVLLLCTFIVFLIFKHKNKILVKRSHFLFISIACIGIIVILLFIGNNFLRISFIAVFVLVLLLILFLKLETYICLNIINQNIFLLLLSTISIIALLFAPYLNIRAFFFMQIFIILLITHINYLVLDNLIISNERIKLIKYLPNLFLFIFSLVFIYRLTTWTLDYYNFDRQRTVSIHKQVQAGMAPVLAQKYPFRKNRYLNHRESYIIADASGGGAWAYKKFHGTDDIIWSRYSYEEINTSILATVSNIPLPENVSEIWSHDIHSININNEKLSFVSGNVDPQIYFPLCYSIDRPYGFPILEIEYITNLGGILQINFDFGDGLSEENSYRITIEKVLELTKIRIPISKWGSDTTLVLIRIDPPDNSLFEIKSLIIGNIIK